MPGPLPAAEKRRRNAPTIPTTALPVSGFAGEIPALPEGYRLRRQGLAWWAWAWRTPQAAAWSDGDLYALARRAMVEDDIYVIDAADVTVDLAELTNGPEARREVEAVLRAIKGLVTGRLSLLKEARDLDDRLGLTPKGLASLRWKIVADAKNVKGGTTDGKSTGAKGSYGHLKTVS